MFLLFNLVVGGIFMNIAGHTWALIALVEQQTSLAYNAEAAGYTGDDNPQSTPILCLWIFCSNNLSLFYFYLRWSFCVSCFDLQKNYRCVIKIDLQEKD